LKEEWKKFMEDEEPHKCSLPEGWETKLNAFQKILFVRCLREDTLTPVVAGNNYFKF